MPKWSKKASKWPVKIVYDKHGRARATIPAPIILGFDKPDTLTFAMINGQIFAYFERKMSTSQELSTNAI